VAARNQNDALRGTLDLLVLNSLSLEPNHGWGISLRVQQRSMGVLEVNQGSLYPALQRLEKETAQVLHDAALAEAVQEQRGQAIVFGIRVAGIREIDVDRRNTECIAHVDARRGAVEDLEFGMTGEGRQLQPAARGQMAWLMRKNPEEAEPGADCGPVERRCRPRERGHPIQREWRRRAIAHRLVFAV
jgi:hypothetical protein